MMESPSSSSDNENNSTSATDPEYVLHGLNLAVRVMHRKSNKEYWCSQIAIDSENQGRDLMRIIGIAKEGLPSAWSYVEDMVNLFLIRQEHPIGNHLRS
jgi:hypothetical protein